MAATPVKAGEKARRTVLTDHIDVSLAEDGVNVCGYGYKVVGHPTDCHYEGCLDSPIHLCRYRCKKLSGAVIARQISKCERMLKKDERSFNLEIERSFRNDNLKAASDELKRELADAKKLPAKERRQAIKEARSHYKAVVDLVRTEYNISVLRFCGERFI